jgi:hypothetical protein
MAGGGTATQQRPKGEVKQGGAYKEETRKIILSLNKIRKVRPRFNLIQYI